jgi:3-(3-hydroxy-phenyl)propionate hydroxylase
VATFDLSMLAGDTNHPYRVQREQWKLMRFLEEELRKLPGSDIRFGHEVTSVRPDDESVTVTAETSSGPVSLTGRYVIAADGARSAVRRSLAVDFEGFTYPELFLIASTDFRFEAKLTDIAYVNYIADPLEWLVLLRVPELWRVLVPAPENSDRRSCCQMTRCSRCCNEWSRGPSRTGSPIAPSIMCISEWRSASVTAAFCSPATPLTSTIRSAEWA